MPEEKARLKHLRQQPYVMTEPAEKTIYGHQSRLLAVQENKFPAFKTSIALVDSPDFYACALYVNSRNAAWRVELYAERF